MNKILYSIKKSIQEGNLQQAVKQLMEVTSQYSSRYHNEVILHSARLQQVLTDERKGIANFDHTRCEKVRITSALLELIDTIRQELADKEVTTSLIPSSLEDHCDKQTLKEQGKVFTADRQNIANILLVTVTKVETQAVLNVIRDKFGREYKCLHKGNKTYYDLGEICGERILLVRSEMGSSSPGGASLTILDAIEQVLPSAIVMVGIAFGLNSKKQHIGDILVSKQLMNYEMQRIGTGLDGELVIIPRGDRPSASVKLLDRFRSGELSWKGAKVQFGLILSGPKLVDNLDFRKQLQLIEPEAIGGEMEGSGLYDAAHLRKTDWILVKAICDWADGKKDENKKQRQEKAAHNAASFTIHVLQQGGFD